MDINIGLIKAVDIDRKFGFITYSLSHKKKEDIYFKITNQLECLKQTDLVLFKSVRDTHKENAIKAVEIYRLVEVSNPKLLLFLFLKSGNLQVLLRLNEIFKQLSKSEIERLILNCITPNLTVIKSNFDFKILRRFLKVLLDCRGISDLFIQETLLSIIENLNSLKYLLILEYSNNNFIQENYYNDKQDLLLVLKKLPKKVKSFIPLNSLTLDFEDVNGNELLSKSLDLEERKSLFKYTTIDTQQKYNLYKLFFQNANKTFKELLNISFSPEFYYKAIVDDLVEVNQQGRVLLKAYLISSSLYEHRELVKKLDWQITTGLFAEDVISDTYKAFNFILSNSIVLVKPKSDELKLSTDIEIKPVVLLKLWLENFITNLNSEIVCVIFLTTNDKELASKILKRGGIEAVLTKSVEYLNKRQEFQKIGIYKNFFNAVNHHSPKLLEKYISQVSIKSTYVEAWLWLEGHSKYFNFEEFKLYFTLSTNDIQKSFLKKVFYEIKNNGAHLSLMQILSLRDLVKSPEISRDFPEAKIDITIHVILQAIQDLSLGDILKPSKMFNIVAEQIKSPEELLLLEGFFDKCDGRKIIDANKGLDDKGHYSLKSDRYSRPNGIVYCEGRKAVQKDDGQPSICEKTNLEYWWCKNSKCYQNCINTHEEWISYTIIDFLQILDIEFNISQYEVLLGYINKVNNFLEHLKCRGCNHILKPISDDVTRNYGFDRVSHFNCDNIVCTEKYKPIYIIHCINGFCQSVIDSRESVKCKPAEKPDNNCGWYICNDCYACCNTAGIEKRKYIYNQTNQKYNCHSIGHKDKGVICCPKCGSEMKAQGYNKEEYEKALKWLIANRNTSRSIIKSGVRPKDGRYWFILKGPDYFSEGYEAFKIKLKKLMSIGFNIPDLNIEKEDYLVGEAFDDINKSKVRQFVCPSCEFSLDMIDDFEKFTSMRKYHVNIEFSYK